MLVLVVGLELIVVVLVCDVDSYIVHPLSIVVTYVNDLLPNDLTKKEKKRRESLGRRSLFMCQKRDYLID